MKFRTLFLAAAIASSTLAAPFLSGCSKHPPAEPASPKSVDLGVVELSSGVPDRHDLGGGSWCVITVEPLGPGTVELLATLEKAGQKPVSTRALPVTTDRPLELSFGDTRVALVPHLK